MLLEDMAQCEEETAYLYRQEHRKVDEWEHHHKQVTAAFLQHMQAAQPAVASGCPLLPTVTRFVPSLSTQGNGKAKVLYEQGALFENDLMDDDEESDVRRSRVGSPRVQSIRPVRLVPIPPRSSTIRTTTPRHDLTSRFHQVLISQLPPLPCQPCKQVRSPFPSSELNPS